MNFLATFSNALFSSIKVLLSAHIHDNGLYFARNCMFPDALMADK